MDAMVKSFGNDQAIAQSNYFDYCDWQSKSKSDFQNGLTIQSKSDFQNGLTIQSKYIHNPTIFEKR